MVISHTPAYRRAWNPKGKFQDLSLRMLVEELGFEGKATGFIFSIEAPGLKAIEEIPNDELQFEAMKRYLNKQIWVWLATRHGSTEPPPVEMEIEVLRDDDITRYKVQEIDFR
jgi:hypothetical protein